LFSIIFCFILIFEASADSNKKSILKIIDKVSSKNYILEIEENNTIIFKNLDIFSKNCIKNDDDHSSFASYITLKDRKKDKFIFKGWILSKNRSLSQISHAIYSIKLIKCL
jgi:hypothetical protein